MGQKPSAKIIPFPVKPKPAPQQVGNLKPIGDIAAALVAKLASGRLGNG